ncbi:hypothetical protein [Rheinheimera fenheensis]|uniref:hypothetical protein n=1 Tax=Rheinheimera fenheensis TaxID=3152295 RepID=UPI00325FE6D4
MKFLLVLIAVLFLSACATSQFNYGKDFASANVQKIEHGKTTKQDLLNYFGEPFQKSVIGANQEKWMYMYTAGESKAQSYVFSMKVESTGSNKMLDILLEDGVVVNHTFTEGQNPYNLNVN